MEQAASQVAGRPMLGVGMVGYAFMGAAHSQAWRTAPHVFDLPLQPAMAVLCGRDAAAGFRRILVTEPGHPYLSGWWPPGHMLGWEHIFTHQVRDLVTAIATGTDPAPSFADGLQVQRVLAAVERSAANGSGWTPVPAN